MFPYMTTFFPFYYFIGKYWKLWKLLRKIGTVWFFQPGFDFILKTGSDSDRILKPGSGSKQNIRIQIHNPGHNKKCTHNANKWQSIPSIYETSYRRDTFVHFSTECSKFCPIFFMIVKTSNGPIFLEYIDVLQKEKFQLLNDYFVWEPEFNILSWKCIG